MITVSRNAIVKALNALLPVAGWHGSVTLSADGTLTLYVYGKDRQRVSLTVTTDDPGTLAPVTVHARGLLDCLRSVAGDVVLDNEKEAKSPALLVTATDTAFTLAAKDAPTPMPPSIAVGGLALVVNGADLYTLIDRAAYCMAADGSYNRLEGFHLELAADRLTGVATDGNRMAWATIPASGALTMPRGTILGAATVRLLRRLPLAGDVRFMFTYTMGTRPARKKGDPDESYMASATVRIEAPGVVVHDPLTIVDFPAWRDVVPATWARSVTIDRDAFVTAMKRGGRMAKDHNCTVRMSIEAGRLVLTSKDYDMGSAMATVPAGLEGEPLATGVDRRYVLAALATLPKGPVTMETGGKYEPIRLRSLVTPDVAGLVMPVRLAEDS